MAHKEKMTSCTIIISHYESVEFLRACVRQIRKFKHPFIDQRILVCDQSGLNTRHIVSDEYFDDYDIGIVFTIPLYSGYGIDYIMRNSDIETEFICQLHADAFPIHPNWLYIPITLIKENNFSFVGQLQFITKPSDTIYPPHLFCAMAQCFNVARTETYKELSLTAGFTRYHQRPNSNLKFINNDWNEWAKESYLTRGSDDDVVAFAWQDKHKAENKLGLSITGMIGRPEDGPSYGRVIEDIVYHFGSCRESIGVFDRMPQKYQDYTNRIKQGFDEGLINEMLAEVTPYKSERTFWDGAAKKAYPTTGGLNKKIEKLKYAVD